jgi:hypothetical protein
LWQAATYESQLMGRPLPASTAYALTCVGLVMTFLVAPPLGYLCDLYGSE